MKKHLKKFQKTKINENVSHKTAPKLKFPSISRRFPEFRSFYKFLFKPVFFMNFIAGFITMAIIFNGIGIKAHYDELFKMRADREQVKKEYTYWKSVVSKYEDYRDGYFRLATLAYRLGRANEAKAYTDKALTIDPLFKPAEILKEKLKN